VLQRPRFQQAAALTGHMLAFRVESLTELVSKLYPQVVGQTTA